MARKILLKTGGFTAPVPTGFKALIVDNNEQIALGGANSKSSYYVKDSKSNTLISDAEYYAWGTYSIYPADYWATFKQSSDTFHLVDMRTVLPTHDFFDNDKQAEYLFGIFKENGSQLNFCGAFDPMELVDINDYIEDYREVISYDITNGGSSYSTTETNVVTTGGSGTGFTVDIECGDADGIITNVTINNAGTGYKVDDVVIISGGDSNAQLTITDVSYSNYNYTNNIFTKDFIKTDGGLKMVNMLWDWDVDNSLTNRYFELDITLSDSGSITGLTCSNFRNLQSPDNSSLEELNPGWTIGEFNYLESFCQKSFADLRLWYFTRTNDSTDQIDYCKYDLVSNTIEVILEDIETWWGANADVDWTDADGNTISVRGGILPHPDKPLLLTYRTVESNPNQFAGNAFDESFLIGPDTYHRFGDNKTTDYQTRLYTKNKMWIINPILP
jgi:hypothetical protein